MLAVEVLEEVEEEEVAVQFEGALVVVVVVVVVAQRVLLGRDEAEPQGPDGAVGLQVAAEVRQKRLEGRRGAELALGVLPSGVVLKVAEREDVVTLVALV